jgi:hypothetical protein
VTIPPSITYGIFTDIVYGQTYNDHAGITVAGTVTVMPQVAQRTDYFFLNESGSVAMRVNLGPVPASSTIGIMVNPGFLWEPRCVCAQQMTVWCSVAGQNFSAGEWV